MATSTVYVTVEFKDKSIPARNLFIKKFTSSEAHTKVIKEFHLMEKESSFFTKFLPNAREFLKVTPSLIWRAEVMISFEQIGKYNARNVSDKNKTIDSMVENGITSCTNMLKSFPVDGADEAIWKLGKLQGKASEMVEDVLTPNSKDDKLLVLNHGDCWNNNMLFKKDEKTGEVTEHIFCDLQVTRLGSPNLDIGYLLFTSMKSNLRRAHLNDCLKHYFIVLEESLDPFGLNCPLTFEEFAEDFTKKFQLGFLMNLIMIPSVGASKDVDQECMADPERMKIEFETAIKKWVTLNPDKAKEVSHEIVEVLKEHAKIVKSGKNEK